MFLLYDFIFILFMLLYLPVFCIKLRQAEDKKRLLLDRFSFFSAEVIERVRNKKVIWIHAVSVGETLAVKNFLEYMHKQYAEYCLILSTVTPTGNRVARSIAAGKAEVIYFPLDLSVITRRVIRLLHPELIVLMEGELWPNLIGAARKAGAKVAIINGRLSPKSFRSYYRVKGLLRSVFRTIDLYLMQTERYAKRLRKIGIPAERIIVTGNMKFDTVEVPHEESLSTKTVRRSCGFNGDDPVLIVASTHRGEESFLCDVFTELRKQFPSLKLLIAPRHIERVNEVVSGIVSCNLSFNVADPSGLIGEFRDQLNSTQPDCYILNTIGQLHIMYGIASVVFMGGSIIKHGGQNPLEAVIHKKPIVTGPHVFNFSEIYESLNRLGALQKITSRTGCVEAVSAFLDNTQQTARTVEDAFQWLQSMRGTSERNGAYINKLISQ